MKANKLCLMDSLVSESSHQSWASSRRELAVKDDYFPQVIVLRHLLIGGKDRHLLRAEIFREELMQESLLVPQPKVFGPADVAALELVAVASVNHAKRCNLK